MNVHSCVSILVLLSLLSLASLPPRDRIAAFRRCTCGSANLLFLIFNMVFHRSTLDTAGQDFMFGDGLPFSSTVSSVFHEPSLLPWTFSDILGGNPFAGQTAASVPSKEGNSTRQLMETSMNLSYFLFDLCLNSRTASALGSCQKYHGVLNTS